MDGASQLVSDMAHPFWRHIFGILISCKRDYLVLMTITYFSRPQSRFFRIDPDDCFMDF
jgi:hypothetical protein